MSTVVTLESLKAMAKQLPVEDRVLLARSILQEIDAEQPPRRKWSEIRGIVPHPYLGEDAQEWVSRTRREADEIREGGQGKIK